MEILQTTSVQIKCPHCGGKFNPGESIEHDLRLQLEMEFETKMADQAKRVEERIRRQEREAFAAQIQALEDEKRQKTARLRELESVSIALRQREQQLKEREDHAEIELKKRLLDRERIVREQTEKLTREKLTLEMREKEQKISQEREMLNIQMKKKIAEEAEKAREEERMKNAELQKKLDDQARLILEMKRRSDQGSMQLQGEVQELAIEHYLQNSFPFDEIQEVSKGKRGGDCVHVVRNDFNQVCGRVLYESKRTKHFSHEWLGKIKEDMRLQQADLAVIVTDAFPEGMTRFGELEGVWICSFLEFKALAMVFRQNLLRIGEVMAAQENRGEKMQMIYSYITGNEFKQKLEAAFESFNEMQEDLMKEKVMFTNHWAKREKKLFKAMENLVSMYGDVRGIAGGAVQEIKALEANAGN